MKPLLLNYTVERTGESDVLFEYDFVNAVNMIQINGEKKPFIDVNNAELAMTTSTRIAREKDDNSLNLVELTTQTKVSREGDDRSNPLLELQTKTAGKRESDD
ncbi:MAG TPA: hypothetical protein VFE57_02220 [Cyclobacteriaceae bacterium]|jgi:hypothetical protein|nr:hypothetical protein [Cyclobacteriaceae bacterium]